jgi:hypothetical protein
MAKSPIVTRAPRPRLSVTSFDVSCAGLVGRGVEVGGMGVSVAVAVGVGMGVSWGAGGTVGGGVSVSIGE